jgi:ATP-dependent protease ClpP protease subunit
VSQKKTKPIRQLKLSGQITKKNTASLIKKLLAAEAQKVGVELSIDSIGGEAISGFDLFDTISNLTVPCTGIVTGCAGSMALVVLQACTRREIVHDGSVQPHNIEVTGKYPEHLRAKVLRIIYERFEKRLVEIILNRTNLGSEQAVHRCLDANRRIASSEAFELGFVDRVFN